MDVDLRFIICYACAGPQLACYGVIIWMNWIRSTGLGGIYGGMFLSAIAGGLELVSLAAQPKLEDRFHRAAIKVVFMMTMLFVISLNPFKIS
jgi:hypothetical protein